MDNHIDKETNDTLLKALSSAQDYCRQLQAKQEKRLWKVTNIPVRIFDALIRLSKAELDKIRKNLNLKNLSALKKDELALRLAYFITVFFKDTVNTLDKERYDLVKRIVKHQGFILAKEITVSKVEALIEYGIAFPGLYNDQNIIFMPEELLSIFQEIDGRELAITVERNTEWIQLTHGLLHYYGVMEVWQAQKMISKLTRQEIDFSEYLTVFAAASRYYGQVDLTDYGFKDERVFESNKIIREQNMRADLDYYSFTKQQLLTAGEPAYFDRTPAMNNFINMILRYYDFEKEEIDEMMFQVSNMINMDSQPSLVMKYLQSYMEIPSLDMMQQIMERLTNLYNHTRMWILKGNTPSELFEEEKKHLMPLPVAPFAPVINESNVFNIRTGTKIGRNDPCPCGSGKKYKKCCGR